jgi:enamine deaminase RidA (YjgF/YER057c/UK114 family)
MSNKYADIVEEKLASLGYYLADHQFRTVRNAYVPVVQAGQFLFVSGQGPRLDGKLLYTGKVGLERSEEEGRRAAEICAFNVLAQIHRQLGAFDRIARVVRLAGLVHCADTFERHPFIIDGASELLLQVLGERGRHTRIATGASSLPHGMTVEIEACFELS